jgi:predicted RNA binding protein YcfA (HicA-like mRNA interferase family)
LCASPISLTLHAICDTLHLPMSNMMKVRDVIKLIETDGWNYAYTRGSHRHFLHPTKNGKVTIAGKPNDDVPKGTLQRILEQAQITLK